MLFLLWSYASKYISFLIFYLVVFYIFISTFLPYVSTLKTRACYLFKCVYVIKLLNYEFSTYMRLHWCNYNISHCKLMWKSDSKWQKVKSLLALFKKTHTTRFICVKSSRQGLCCCCWMTLAQSEMGSYKQDQNKATGDH